MRFECSRRNFSRCSGDFLMKLFNWLSKPASFDVICWGRDRKKFEWNLQNKWKRKFCLGFRNSLKSFRINFWVLLVFFLMDTTPTNGFNSKFLECTSIFSKRQGIPVLTSMQTELNVPDTTNEISSSFHVVCQRTSRLLCDLHFSHSQLESLSRGFFETINPLHFSQIHELPYVESSEGSWHLVQSQSKIFVWLKCRLRSNVGFKVSV